MLPENGPGKFVESLVTQPHYTEIIW